MKNVANRPIHMLSELTQRVIRDARREAMESYLESNLHNQILIGASLVEQCDASTRELLKGNVTPHLDICCCADTFTAILTGLTIINYKGCDLPEDEASVETACDPSEIIGLDEVIANATFAKLSKLSSSTLRERLVRDYDCVETTYGQHHEKDSDFQRTYYKSILRRFNTAAQYAKAIGSESVRLWLEAVCLIQPRPQLVGSAHIPLGLNLDEDCVAEAYQIAERAQRVLWVDVALRKLPSALPKTRKARH